MDLRNWCQKIQTNSHDILVFHIFVLGIVCGNKKKGVVKMITIDQLLESVDLVNELKGE